jgi:hypothetical protein
MRHQQSFILHSPVSHMLQSETRLQQEVDLTPTFPTMQFEFRLLLGCTLMWFLVVFLNFVHVYINICATLNSFRW